MTIALNETMQSKHYARYMHCNVKTEENRLLTLVNDLNRAMFTIFYQSLNQPPAASLTTTRCTSSTVLTASDNTDSRPMTIRLMLNPTPSSTSLRSHDMTRLNMNVQQSDCMNTDVSASIPSVLSTALTTREEGNHRPPARHAQAYVQSHPNLQPHLSINANTVTTIVDPTSDLLAVNRNAMGHVRLVTDISLPRLPTGQTDPRSPPTNEEISERGDDGQDC
jgi:hypothetical protein